ncbi:C40 family peptidase [Algoriphagus halophytocola]|uniref:C40 family peptidase n=1 Tax=Algoriphagus halophytocola TaxID=2991499 RepID=A0ABY6MD99_9BACT|nr:MULTISPECIES: C40 family peptidase [unclassified Algoriphagus]UZD21103.1 C40 family peptidase [Algoriphagus sp. TR-M5]WBL42270.1 C40 family peptidase [Algoriphagus sp. TR-M9]
MRLEKFRFQTLLLLILASFSFSCASKKKVANEPFNQVISTARSYTGTPYRFGGTTRAGMDCSALVYHSFYAVGITMPRMSADQSKVGKTVRTNDIKPGDVLFFATGKRRKQVTHSGIVTETSRGDVRFIHASSSLGVSEDYLSNRYWSKAFLFARRVLD